MAKNQLASIAYDSLDEGYVWPAPLAQKTLRSVNVLSYSARAGAARYSVESSDESVRMKSALAEYSLHDADAKEPAESEFLQEQTIAALEDVLGNHYGKPCTVTNIRALPNCKHKKEVRFMIDNYLSQVWVFKANQATTSREMIAYEIAYKHGIPTGKPIGYMPKYDHSYPYDIAIIGGVVEHSRESFDSVVEGLKRKPALVLQVANLVAQLIAQYQGVLSEHKEEFAARDVQLNPFDPERILTDRLFAGLGIPASPKLIGLVQDLYARQRGPLVVSECDTHTGNIVPVAQFNQATGQIDTHLAQFGIIDWDLIDLDYPFADPVDFFVHLERRVGQSDQLDFTKFLESYCAATDGAAGGIGDGFIQKAWWHISEVADPHRKNPADAARKRLYHYPKAMEALIALRSFGIPVQALCNEFEKVVGPHI